MSFDIDITINEMKSVISGIISDELPDVINCIEKALEEEKEALKSIALARINNEIDDEDMEEHLKDEKIALKAAILACQVKAKAMVQNVVNSAMDVLMKAISAAM